MNNFANMPVAGLAVIVIIAVLFILAVLLLFTTYGRYKHLASMVNGNLNKDNSFLRFVVNDFADAYKKYGQEVNTPAIIANGAKYWFWFGLGQIFFAVVCNVRTFFESVGRSNIALLSGIGELLGNLLCALWIIPVFGNIGRSLAHTSGYFLAMLFLLIAYFFSRKRIYRKAQ